MSADGAEAAEDVAPVPFSFKVAGGKATLKLAITEVALAQLEAELGLPQYQPAADGSASGSGAGCAGVVSDAVKASGRAARLVRTVLGRAKSRITLKAGDDNWQPGNVNNKAATLVLLARNVTFDKEPSEFVPFSDDMGDQLMLDALTVLGKVPPKNNVFVNSVKALHALRNKAGQEAKVTSYRIRLSKALDAVTRILPAGAGEQSVNTGVHMLTDTQRHAQDKKRDIIKARAANREFNRAKTKLDLAKLAKKSWRRQRDLFLDADAKFTISNSLMDVLTAEERSSLGGRRAFTAWCGADVQEAFRSNAEPSGDLMDGLEAAVLRYGVGPDKRQAESQLKRRVAKAVKRHQHVFITDADAVVFADALGRMLEAELAGDAVLDPASDLITVKGVSSACMDAMRSIGCSGYAVTAAPRRAGALALDPSRDTAADMRACELLQDQEHRARIVAAKAMKRNLAGNLFAQQDYFPGLDEVRQGETPSYGLLFTQLRIWYQDKSDGGSTTITIFRGSLPLCTSGKPHFFHSVPVKIDLSKMKSFWDRKVLNVVTDARTPFTTVLQAIQRALVKLGDPSPANVAGAHLLAARIFDAAQLGVGFPLPFNHDDFGAVGGMIQDLAEVLEPLLPKRASRRASRKPQSDAGSAEGSQLAAVARAMQETARAAALSAQAAMAVAAASASAKASPQRTRKRKVAARSSRDGGGGGGGGGGSGEGDNAAGSGRSGRGGGGCWDCSGPHLRRDCPLKGTSGTAANKKAKPSVRRGAKPDG